MNDSQYITIAEYARQRNVSVSAVYKRLGGTLQPFVKEINGKKYLSVEALNDGFQPGENEKNPEQKPSAAVLDALLNQLAEKDKQIARLQDELTQERKNSAEKDAFIRTQASKLTLLLEQSQELNRNNQVLLGVEKGFQPRLTTVEEPSIISTDAPGDEKPKDTQSDMKTDKKAPGGILGRLFGGKKK
jgi:alpha-D-ribose 1-methylphosphonate 5-triphosphate synthase subunit PhnG